MKSTKTCLVLILSLLALQAKALDLTQPATCVETQAPAEAKASVAGDLYSALLPGDIVYWRAGSFTPATNWAGLQASAANAFASARGLILDLRGNTSPADFGGALHLADFLGRDRSVSPFGQVAFRDAGHAPAMLIVLTNRETRGAAEALAAKLQAQGALVMGEATVGTHPVTPDVATTANARDEAVSLALIDHRQVDAVIAETAVRHRMSEAALVQGQDPEQDAFIASHEEPAVAARVPATRDIALVEALDSFKAIRVVEGQESSPLARVASSSSAVGPTVIASSGLGR